MEENKTPKAELEHTPEQYKELITALKSQNAQLMYQLQGANLHNMFKRLDYLFKVVENAVVFDEAFVDQCVKEIKELMTPPEEDKEED